ncbi:MAG TPA: M15 family metallopeptidase [Gammaproteobacteria bacterium]|nr:M15 family metallopeptidase [Gammaproteobacteria bacterium]
MINSELFADLGIPIDYGRNPRRPAHPEAHELEDVEANIVGRMQQLAPDTARDWRRMKSAAFTDGVEILLVSGFRSVRHQTDLIRRKLSKGVEIARILEVNAAPGFSEHHTGRAVDVATPGTRPLSEDFESSAAFAWLTGHGARFGFTMPYGRNNVYGFSYEPWHWSQLGAQTKRRAQSRG